MPPYVSKSAFEYFRGHFNTGRHEGERACQAFCNAFGITDPELFFEEDEAEAFKIEAIDLITFCLRDLHQSYGAEGAGNDSTERSVMKEDNTQTNRIVEQFSAMLVPIVSGLLSSVEKLSNSMQNLEYALPALELIQEILTLLKDSSSKYRENKEILPQSVENFN